MAGVTLKNVTKAYGKNVILEDINLTVKDREFCVLVGASGCGKSTLLRMIAGLEDITAGEIFIGDKCVNKVPARDRDCAMVFQSYALYPHMNVFDNIAFGLKMRNFKHSEIKRRVEEVAQTLGLSEYLHRKPKELSGGQRQRVALGRAIVREPKVFLMDEPLSNLDAKLRISMRSEIKKLARELKTTFVYVTHDQTEALTMGDRIVVLDDGVIAQVDTPQNIYKYPKNVFVATFMGAMPMNIIPARLVDECVLGVGDSYVRLSDDILKTIGDRKEVLVGVRPEQMTNQRFFSPQSNTLRFKVLSDFEETLGAQKVIYFTFGGAKCSAKVEAFVDTTKPLDFFADMRDVSFFDTQTQERLD